MMNIEELRERMGSKASTAEAERMADLLAQRGIDDISDVDAMDDHEFFALIPQCIGEASA